METGEKDVARREHKVKKKKKRRRKKVVDVKWTKKKIKTLQVRVNSKTLGAKATSEAEIGRAKKDEQQKKKITTNQFLNTTESLRIIAAYHTAEKRLEQIMRDTNMKASEKKRVIKEIELEKIKLGGLEAYQQASIYGAKASKYTCAQTIVPLIRTHLPSSGDSKQPRRKGKETVLATSKGRPFVLDVGAIDNQYDRFRTELEIVPIDLNPQDAGVIRADFFEFAKDMIRRRRLPTCARKLENRNGSEDDGGSSRGEAIRTDPSPSRVFDVVIMSLVVNFVGDPRLRGEMLALAAHRNVLRIGGLLFVSLPSASLSNSRYMDENRFQELVCSLGFDLVSVSVSKKIYLATFRLRKSFEGYRYSKRQGRGGEEDADVFRYEKEFKRVHVRKGTKRNNFCVMLKNAEDA
eukprot:g2531.t1